MRKEVKVISNAQTRVTYRTAAGRGSRETVSPIKLPQRRSSRPKSWRGSGGRSRGGFRDAPLLRSCSHNRELGQRRDADVGFRANTGRSVGPRWMSAHSHKRTFADRRGVRRTVRFHTNAYSPSNLPRRTRATTPLASQVPRRSARRHRLEYS